jgi:hypothetical protein
VERCSDCCSLALGGERDDLRAVVVGEDRGEVPVSETARIRRSAQRLVDQLVAVQRGEVDGLGELAPHSARAGRGGSDQPCLRARADRKERLVVRAGRARLALQRPAGRGG